MKNTVLGRNPGLLPFLVSRFAYVLGAAGSPVLLTLTTLVTGKSLTSLALVLGAGALPAVVGALSSKWLSDRFTTRALLMATTALWVASAGITAGMFGGGAPTLAWLCVVSFVVELAAALQYPSLGSYLPLIVHEEHLERANSARSFVVAAAGVLGPALFAFTGGLIPLQAAWIILTAVMVLSALPLARLPRGQSFEPEAGAWADLRTGWSYFWRSPGIRTVVTVSGAWHLLGWSVLSVAGPVVLRDHYHDLSAWGWLQAALAAGSLGGALVAARLRARRVARWALASLTPALLLGALIAVQVDLPWLFPVAAATGAAMSIGGVLWVSALQREVPSTRLGQVFGYDYLFSEAINPIGLLLVPSICLMAGGERQVLGIASITVFAVVVAAVLTVPGQLTPTELPGRSPGSPSKALGL